MWYVAIFKARKKKKYVFWGWSIWGEARTFLSYIWEGREFSNGIEWGHDWVEYMGGTNIFVIYLGGREYFNGIG